MSLCCRYYKKYSVDVPATVTKCHLCSNAKKPRPPAAAAAAGPFSAGLGSGQELKSLLLNHSDYFGQRQMEGASGAMFSKCPQEGTWFVVHPDFRREPGMRPQVMS